MLIKKIADDKVLIYFIILPKKVIHMSRILVIVALLFSTWTFNASASYMVVEKDEILSIKKQDSEFKLSVKDVPGWQRILMFKSEKSIAENIIYMPSGDIKIINIGPEVKLKTDVFILRDDKNKDSSTFFNLTVMITFLFALFFIKFVTSLRKKF